MSAKLAVRSFYLGAREGSQRYAVGVTRGAQGRQEWSAVAARETGAVLLERAPSAGDRGRSLLFREPVRVIEASAPEGVSAALAALEQALAEGLHVAGFLSYEAGFALERSLADLAAPLPGGMPLVWFGCYREPWVSEEERADAIGAWVAGNEAAPVFSLTEDEYARRVERVRELIAAGETYQANLTFDVSWSAGETAAEMYERLLRAQPVPYAALLQPQAGWHVLSFSPELFFRREGRRIVTRPMKGTAAPGMDTAEMRAQAAWLRADPKNRAENVMIVDLLRNDLGRICETGSVEVTRLFEVERYPTVLQMTSTVEGRLREGVGWGEIFAALFPSGSIVGAPKLHTQRLLHELERRPRGVYTGAIGWIAPNGVAEFNVAIRTVSLRGGAAVMGVGSGIVYDSDAASEYAECQTKVQFLTRAAEAPFSLIETLRLEGGAYARVELHVERMRESAEFFGMHFAPQAVRNALDEAAATWAGEGAARVRLLLSREGRVSWTRTALPAPDDQPVDLLMNAHRVDAEDRFLRHKTTRRALYDEAFAEAQAKGFADALFCNTRGELTEGAIHNVIVSLDGQWYTPAVRSGVLPGLYRRTLMEEGRLREHVLGWEDARAAEAMFVCNSVRGLRRVRRIVGADAKVLWSER